MSMKAGLPPELGPIRRSGSVRSSRPKAAEVHGSDMGIMRWSAADLDLRMFHLKRKRCDNCGGPATLARRGLDDTHERTFLCIGCWPQGRGGGARR